MPEAFAEPRLRRPLKRRWRNRLPVLSVFRTIDAGPLKSSQPARGRDVEHAGMLAPGGGWGRRALNRLAGPERRDFGLVETFDGKEHVLDVLSLGARRRVRRST